MDASSNLNLPFIMAAQAQKHVTHNEALRALDAVVQLMVLDKDLGSPPIFPAEGARYIVATSPAGAWSGQAGKVAAWQDGVWAFYAPREGWLAWAADEDALYVWTGAAWAAFAGGREILTANRTYYVRTDGSDSNDGLADTGGGAFLTIQKAIDAAASLDLSTYDVTISIGAGTYTGANVLKRLVGAGLATISGAGASTVVSTTAADCFFGAGVVNWVLSGMKLTATTSGSAIRAVDNAQVRFTAIEFGSVPNGSYHIFADQGAIIEATGDYTITGGASAHMRATWNGIVAAVGRTVTSTGTFSFPTAFALASRGGFMRANGNTYTGGTITGARYSVDQISQIFTNGAGAAYFPGDASGTADGATFGLYG